MVDKPEVNIDWSCCEPDIRDKIDKKFYEKFGLHLDGAISGDIRVVSKVATVLNSVYKDMSE